MSRPVWYSGAVARELQLIDLIICFSGNNACLILSIVSKPENGWAFDLDADAIQGRIEAMTDEAMTLMPDARMNWSAPQMIPLLRVTHSRLSDLLVRSTLVASSLASFNDQDEVRLGTLPLFFRGGCYRLDKEMKRLSYRFGVEARVLAKQARKLSPEAHGS